MSRIPSKPEILDWIADHPQQTSKRDIAKAFGIKGSDRIELKRLLKELEADGQIEKKRKTYRDPDKLPPVSVLKIIGPDADGDIFAKPMEWTGEGPEPKVLFIPREADAALGAGDRILARLNEVRGHPYQYEARLIRRIGHTPQRILGIFRKSAEGGRIVPIDKKADKEWLVPAGATEGARDGELVEGEQSGPRAHLGLPRARITDRLGDPTAARSVSLISIHQHGIPDHFPEAVLKEVEACEPKTGEGREDLTKLPLITIDPSDARDHDDAVFAMADDTPGNPDGHIVWVAIADVAAYVRPGTALDREARNRGNSTYFPDRVVPMLPDRLSGDLCSLHEGVDRPCIAVKMTLDAQGNKIAHRFTRAMMNSRASLNYQEVQAAVDGTPNDRTAPLLNDVLKPLYAAYRSAQMARENRQPLDLDLPERKIELDEQGNVTAIQFRDRLDAHRLIEEFMILANIAAAEELQRLRRPLLFRVHEEPSPDKLDALRDVAAASGFTLAKGQVLHTRALNNLLDAAVGTEFSELINMSTLRSMTQAYYHPENFGHFGLALRNYAHFTSPIRRYSDLIVHRALISGHSWGKDGLSEEDIDRLEDTAVHISETERRSMMAERDTTDRYIAAYLADRVGNEFTGRISGIARFGVFVKLDETGADGLVPIRELGREYFNYDRESQTLMGSESGRIIKIGQKVLVRLAQAEPVTGGLTLELLEIEGKTQSGGPRKTGKRVVRRKVARAKAKDKNTKRKVTRKRR